MDRVLASLHLLLREKRGPLSDGLLSCTLGVTAESAAAAISKWVSCIGTGRECRSSICLRASQ
eukprot:6186986-Pleurochrysis_carterae.AAC.7